MAEPDHKKQAPPPFSDLIVVHPSPDKYITEPPASFSDRNTIDLEKAEIAEKRLGTGNHDEKMIDGVAVASVEKKKKGTWTRRRIIILLVAVIILLVGVIAAVVGTLLSRKGDDHVEAAKLATPSNSSTISGSHNMSGSAQAVLGYVYPTLVTPDSSTIHVLTVGNNASLYVKTMNITSGGNSSTDWQSLGGTITPGIVAAVSRGPGTLNAFSRGTNGDLYHKYLSNSTWGPSTYDWDDRKGQLQNAPEVISWGDNRLDVFAIGEGNGLNTMSWNTSNQADWGSWIPLGGSFSTKIMPSAVSWGKGRIDVFAVGKRDGILYRRFLDKNATNWQPFYGFENLGGKLTGRPIVVTWGPGRLDVFARGGDGGLWHMFMKEGLWSDWHWLGADIRGEPAAVSCAKDRIDVFVWGEDFHYYSKGFDGTNWSPAEGFKPMGGGEFGGPPKVITRSEGVIDLFGYSSRGSVMHRSWDKKTFGWTPEDGFENWGGPGIPTN